MSIIGKYAHFETYSRIRQAVASDSVNLSRLIAGEDGDWKDAIGDPSQSIWLAEEGHLVVGLTALQGSMESPRARLRAVRVDSSARGRGVGTLLLQNCVDHARSMGMSLISVSRPLRGTDWLEKRGFKVGPDRSSLELSLWCNCNAIAQVHLPLPLFLGQGSGPAESAALGGRHGCFGPSHAADFRDVSPGRQRNSARAVCRGGDGEHGAEARF